MFSDGKIGADDGEVADLIESTIVRGPKKRDGSQRPLLLTTRREALALYRDVLRYSNLFVWRDQHGRVWRDVIRSSARQELEAARREDDPELVSKMLVTGRDAVQKTVEQFMKRRQQIIEEEAAARDAGGTPSFGGSGDFAGSGGSSRGNAGGLGKGPVHG
ncbi:hypothetical protein MNEG_5664 [Monoraphidium neglectum]|jgi:hypothetical protein|uniref:Complex 1 LYR protein domain-containing protein n=1 Tax=Monoraphidium neglectum TaxID=145388 RepID=A0A0D2MGU5_9CHLO|nr:hypothetical protein MNEG_5664 [Monoraphidium neglectum]KIZ02295.1 hypothetical protein MNEG_5664 [Monoraphidium neglectum]|eukprot:XP_013901314.1 hypothetical protein MNEG_5664 [Monoraphidium neglectum]